MTVLSDMRDRLASAVQLQLAHRGFTVGADVAYLIADRALGDAQVEALTGYVAAVEAGADPADARAILADDALTSALLAS